MSSRYQPAHDPRYAPRARSRSPHNHQDWRSQGPSGPGFSNRHAEFGRGRPEPPRGPKTFIDPIRPNGPGAGPAAPLGPRGRGAPPRAEFRELRDAPPLGTDRSFVRDRDFDRRARPVSPRPRSPLRGFRDAPPPRDLDISRSRRDSRDGPLPPNPTYSDQQPFGQPGFNRGGFSGRGRGRGRGDFEFRDRGRRGPIDDRPAFRPRDRSPLPRWGSMSRPDREDWRPPERREEDRWLDRDDRERESDRFRKDSISANRFESRPSNEGPTRTPTPHQNIASSVPLPAERSSQPDQAKDDVVSRRFSTSMPNTAVKEPRREPLPSQADLLAGRVESSTAKYGSRTSSPPPPGPQVPAFGSFSIKPSVYSGPTSNVWKAPADVRQNIPPTRPTGAPSVPAVPLVPSPIPKTVPTAPKAQLNAAPAAAPRAPRALEGGPIPFSGSLDERVPAAPKSWNASTSQPQIPTAPWALRSDERSASVFAQPSIRDGRSVSTPYQSNAPSVPVSPRASNLPARALDTGPSPSAGLQSQATASETGARDAKLSRSDTTAPKPGTPPPAAPSGPRRTHSFSTSPVVHSPNIPTAPKAIRGPPIAPRAVADRGLAAPIRPSDRGSAVSSRAPLNAPRAPAWNQWIRPGAPIYRDPVVPAKRDANGDEKVISSRSHASPVLDSARRVSESSSVKYEDPQEEVRPKTTPFFSDEDPDQRSTDSRIPDFDGDKLRGRSYESPEYEPPKATQDLLNIAEVSSDETSDDEGMDLDEEDFAQSKAKFERQKAHLESQLINLSARPYRAVTPLEQIARLARVSVHDLGLDADSSLSAGERLAEAMDEDVDTQREASPVVDEEGDQQDLLTPKQEELEDIEEVMRRPDPLDDILPPVVSSADVVRLPFLNKHPLTPLSERGVLQDIIARQNASKTAVITYLEGKLEDENLTEQDLRDEYLTTYRQWVLDLEVFDRSRVEKERDDRQASVDLGPDPEATFPTAETPAVESSRSRLHKFSSEYDIQKVLKESEETARIEQERLDRESKKIQADLEREAIIPDIYDEMTRQRRLYKNTNRYRSASCLTDIFGYEPPQDTFTEEEHKKFLDIFKERPKKWGEIARQLPGRTYADCIHHYYAFKWDGRFRETKSKRKGKGARGRGGKAAPRTRGSALMADLSRGDEDPSNPSAFTETGRPRRAATRTTYGEKDIDSKGSNVNSTLGKKAGPTLEQGTEKPAKRRKAATGEKGGKRGRQPLAAAPAASPATYDKESIPSKEELAHAQSLEEASLLTGLQAGRRGIHADPMAMFAHENLSQAPSSTDINDRSRQSGQPALHRSTASSYWSVPEQTDFIKFIGHFGTDFSGIANHMGTKTQTMVKNHYLRLIESGSRQDIVDAASNANARRERGENMGLPPTPTPITKRRYDNPPTLPRSLISQGDFMDLDEPMTNVQPPMQVQAQTSQYPQPPRFMTPSQPVPHPQQRVNSDPTQVNTSPAPSKQTQQGQTRSNPPPGPKMGFFSEPRIERRPTLSSLPSGRSIQQAMQIQGQQQQDLLQQQARLPQEGQIPSPEFMENLEREKARAMNLQAQALHERISQDRLPPVASPFQSHALHHGRPVPSGVPDRRIEPDERPETPGASVPLVSRQPQSMFRNIMGSPAPTAQSPIILNPPSFRPAPIASPPKRDDFRPSSVPAPSPAQSVVNVAPGPLPAETRKTSNVMSLLNSEPADPRPVKTRMSDQSSSALYNRAHSPAPQGLGAGTAPSTYIPRREVFSQTPGPRSDFERPSFAQPAAHVPTPPLQHERLAGGTMTPGGSRQDWAARPPTSQPPLSSSPHPPTPLAVESRGYFTHHRASMLGGLSSQARHNPSPPPNSAYMHHSRTPSLSQPLTPGQGQGQSMQHMQPTQQPAPQSASSLQSNPYSQSSVNPSHMQQVHAQQSQIRHAHNASIGSTSAGPHRRGVQTHPDEEYYYRQQQREHEQRGDQLRQEYERQQIDRARESEARFQAQQQARQQEQRQYPHYQQGPPQPIHNAHTQPFSAQSTGLGLREQSYREAHSAMQRDAMQREGQTYQAEGREHSQIPRRQYEEEERFQYEQSMRNNAYSGGRPGGYQHRR